MQSLADLVSAIPARDLHAERRAQKYIDELVKPVGSLGELETLAARLASLPGWHGKLQCDEKVIIVMCADHGVYDENIAISPRQVTAIQAVNMTKKKTGVCALAATVGARVHVVDMGIDCDPLPEITSLKIARSSNNIARGPAMSYYAAVQQLLASAHLTRVLAEKGTRLFGVGELGMANTTAAAAMVCVLTDTDPRDVVGVGANYPKDQLQHKIDVVRRAINTNHPDASDGIDVLAKVGGYDLVGMAGVMLGAASCGLPIVIDGFLSYAAALAACRISPAVHQYLIPSHYSAEKGAQIALTALQLKPYLHMKMRLGEGSGAALAMHLVDAACSMYNMMGTLVESNIVFPAQSK